MSDVVIWSLRGAVLVLILISFMALYRVIWGPTASDRVVAVNVITTNVILAIVIVSYLTNNYTFIDVAFVYVLCAFVGTLCVIKALGKGHLD